VVVPICNVFLYAPIKLVWHCTFYWGVCTKPGKWVVMYMLVGGWYRFCLFLHFFLLDFGTVRTVWYFFMFFVVFFYMLYNNIHNTVIPCETNQWILNTLIIINLSWLRIDSGLRKVCTTWLRLFLHEPNK